MSDKHCATCSCPDRSKWFPYDRDRDQRERKWCSSCSPQRSATARTPVVLHFTYSGARRYLCQPCAEKAGFDGTYTTTLGGRLIDLWSQFHAGEIDVHAYLKAVSDTYAADQVGSQPAR